MWIQSTSSYNHRFPFQIIHIRFNAPLYRAAVDFVRKRHCNAEGRGENHESQYLSSETSYSQSMKQEQVQNTTDAKPKPFRGGNQPAMLGRG